MKLPKTKFEPTIENGQAHGIPYTTELCCLFPTPHSAQGLSWYQNKGVNVGNVLAARLHHVSYAPYSPVVIPNVPIACIRALSYDVCPVYTPTGPVETQDWADDRNENFDEYTLTIWEP